MRDAPVVLFVRDDGRTSCHGCEFSGLVARPKSCRECSDVDCANDMAEIYKDRPEALMRASMAMFQRERTLWSGTTTDREGKTTHTQLVEREDYWRWK